MDIPPIVEKFEFVTMSLIKLTKIYRAQKPTRIYTNAIIKRKFTSGGGFADSSRNYSTIAYCNPGQNPVEKRSMEKHNIFRL